LSSATPSPASTTAASRHSSGPFSMPPASGSSRPPGYLATPPGEGLRRASFRPGRC
jgi:hypothetical protein